MHGRNTIMAKEITYDTTFNPNIKILLTLTSKLFADLAEKKTGGGCFFDDLCLPDSRAYQSAFTNSQPLFYRIKFV